VKTNIIKALEEGEEKLDACKTMIHVTGFERTTDYYTDN
jgi:hypothetical protein